MLVKAKIERIASAIEADVHTGRIYIGDAHENEGELVRRFTVCRSAIRKCLPDPELSGLSIAF